MAHVQDGFHGGLASGCPFLPRWIIPHVAPQLQVDEDTEVDHDDALAQSGETVVPFLASSIGACPRKGFATIVQTAFGEPEGPRRVLHTYGNCVFLEWTSCPLANDLNLNPLRKNNLPALLGT